MSLPLVIVGEADTGKTRYFPSSKFVFRARADGRRGLVDLLGPRDAARDPRPRRGNAGGGDTNADLFILDEATASPPRRARAIF